jgi:23S rRNA pseudouridine2605 synthase
MWESQGVQVSRLIRVRYGTVNLPRNLKMGQWEELDQNAIDQLASACGVVLKKRVGLYGRAKMRVGTEDEADVRRGGYLRRRRF